MAKDKKNEAGFIFSELDLQRYHDHVGLSHSSLQESSFSASFFSLDILVFYECLKRIKLLSYGAEYLWVYLCLV